jgi:hypothetical protein
VVQRVRGGAANKLRLLPRRKKVGKGEIRADRDLAGALAMARRRNLAQYLDADGQEGAHGVELVKAELGASPIGRGWSRLRA